MTPFQALGDAEAFLNRTPLDVRRGGPLGLTVRLMRLLVRPTVFFVGAFEGLGVAFLGAAVTCGGRQHTGGGPLGGGGGAVKLQCSAGPQHPRRGEGGNGCCVLFGMFESPNYDHWTTQKRGQTKQLLIVHHSFKKKTTVILRLMSHTRLRVHRVQKPLLDGAVPSACVLSVCSVCTTPSLHINMCYLYKCRTPHVPHVPPPPNTHTERERETQTPTSQSTHKAIMLGRPGFRFRGGGGGQ